MPSRRNRRRARPKKKSAVAFVPEEQSTGLENEESAFEAQTGSGNGTVLTVENSNRDNGDDMGDVPQNPKDYITKTGEMPEEVVKYTRASSEAEIGSEAGTEMEARLGGQASQQFGANFDMALDVAEEVNFDTELARDRDEVVGREVKKSIMGHGKEESMLDQVKMREN